MAAHWRRVHGSEEAGDELLTAAMSFGALAAPSVLSAD